jgi:hypothetical protein
VRDIRLAHGGKIDGLHKASLKRRSGRCFFQGRKVVARESLVNLQIGAGRRCLPA